MVKRKTTKKALAIQNVNPTAITVPAREGGLLKFGGAPLGLGARGVLEGSIC